MLTRVARSVLFASRSQGGWLRCASGAKSAAAPSPHDQDDTVVKVASVDAPLHDKQVSNSNADSIKREEGVENAENLRGTGDCASTAESSDAPKQVHRPDLDIEELVEEMALMKTQIGDLTNKYMRALAEAENIRKRSEREIKQAHKYSIGGFAKQLLEVADNLGLAVNNVPKTEIEGDKNPSLKTLYEGLVMTRDVLNNVLHKNDIIIIDSIGRKFDPNFHDVMAEIPDEKAEPGTIVQVAKDGYMIKDRVLRPAMVCTAKKP